MLQSKVGLNYASTCKLADLGQCVQAFVSLALTGKEQCAARSVVVGLR